MASRAAGTYAAFGLTVASEIDLPELERREPTPVDAADVVVRRGDFERTPPADGDAAFRRVAPDEYHLLFPAADVAVRGGREITVDPAPDVPEEIVRHLVVGPAINHLLHQRGRFVLHASAVEVDGAGVAFVGESGQGKTTTAMAFLLEGCRVLSDDVAALEFVDGEPRIRAGYPSIKLDPAAVEHFDAPVEAPERISSARDRHFYGLRNGQPADPVPLERIYLLEDGGEETVEPLPPVERVTSLVENTYTVGLLEAEREAVSNLEACGRLAESVSVARLRRRRTFEALPAVVEMVREDLAEPC